MSKPLTRAEEIVLLTAAYCGKHLICTYSLLNRVFAILKEPTDTHILLMCMRLTNSELLQHPGNTYKADRVQIHDSIHLAMLERLYTDEKNKPLLEALRSIDFPFDETRLADEAFRTWLLHIVGIEPVMCSSFLTPSYEWKQLKILKPQVDNPFWEKVMLKLPLDKFAALAMDMIYQRFSQGEAVNWPQIERLINTERYSKIRSTTSAVTEFGALGLPHMRDFVWLFRYLTTGAEAPEPVNDNNQWGLLYRAVTALYAWRTAEAIAHFRQALLIWDGSMRPDRSAFGHFLFNYLYIVALLIDSSAESRQLLHQYKRSNFFAVDPLLGSTLQPLIRYFINDEPITCDGRFNHAPKLDAPTAALINNIFAYIQKKPGIDVCREMPPAPFYIIERESDPATSRLMQIKVRQPWEKAIDFIEGTILPTSPNADVQAQARRIVYLVDDDFGIVPMIQRRNSNGTWAEGLRKLWTFGNQHIIPDFATAEDHRILSSFGQNNRLTGGRGFLALVGCTRLFRREIVKGEGLQPVEITHERPYLVVDRNTDGSLTVMSNLSLDDLQDCGDDMVVRRRDPDHYELMTLAQWERNTFSALLQVGRLPAEAEERLTPMLQRLSECSDVHSPLLGNESAALEGDTRTVVRVYPRQQAAETWAMRLSVMPYLVNGILETPGEGQSMYVVTGADGWRVCLHRNLEAERASEQRFLDFFASMASLEAEEEGQRPDYDQLRLEVNEYAMGLDKLLEVVEWIQQHSADAVLEIMNGAKFRVRGTASLRSISVASTKKHDWFAMEGEVVLDADKVLSLNEFLVNLDNGVGDYIRLDDNSFVKMTADLRRKVQLLKAITRRNAGELTANQWAMAALEGEFGDEMSSADANVVSLRRKLRDMQAKDIPLPQGLTAQLKEYQKEGFEWMARLAGWAGGACLADDMGLGKTVQAIALMLHLQHTGPALVVAPTSVVANWQREVERFAPGLAVTVLNEVTDRTGAINKAAEGSVVVVSYGMLLSHADALASRRWGVICIDEAHTIKNHTTKTYRATVALKGHFRLILTGTPVQNHLLELWSLFQFILPGLLGPFADFKRRYLGLEREFAGTTDRIMQLRKAVAPFILRRTKSQVLSELPPLQDYVRYVKLSPDEMAVYEAHRQSAKKRIGALVGVGSSLSRQGKVSALAMLTTLREIPCSCSLVMQGWTDRSTKEQALLDLLAGLDLEQHGVLVFSQFTTYLHQVQQMLADEGIDSYLLDGSVAQPRRKAMIEAYQRGDGPAVFLISLKAGGVGLNLTRADYVVHLDPWWNPAVERQATDRAHRIGQQQPVTAFHFIAEHTIEEKMLRLHENKRFLSDTLLTGTDRSGALTFAEILDLLT